MKIAVIGAGAVGCYYGGMLARAGHEVVLIGRAPHVEAIARHGLRLQTQTFDEYVRAPGAALSASVDVAAVAGAALVLFCVKSTDTESAGAALKPYLARLAPDALVLSLQNGVDNAARLQDTLYGARNDTQNAMRADGKNNALVGVSIDASIDTLIDASIEMPTEAPTGVSTGGPIEGSTEVPTEEAPIKMPIEIPVEDIPAAAASSINKRIDRPVDIIAPKVAATVVYVAAEMAGPGHVRHHGRGELIIEPIGESAVNPIGSPAESTESTSARSNPLADEQTRKSPEFSESARTSRKIASLLIDAGIPTEISANVRGALWAKLILNCAYNALSAIMRLPYGQLVQRAGIASTMRDIVAECVAVARADGVTLPDDIDTAVRRIAETMPDQYSSTAQDLMRGKRTEIDHLNGLIVRRGDVLGVPVPVNQLLYAVVRGMENAGYFGAVHQTEISP